jgi:inhibitor of KinA sporulation pathway (predicted exonuclease)
MFLIIDFEATCWTDGINHKDNEIIEIGAVMVHNFALHGTFGTLIKPVRNPQLSDFCTRLTSITQEQVDQGTSFDNALAGLDLFIRSCKFPDEKYNEVIFCSWGHYDKNQLKRDCDYHKVPFPFDNHISLKHEFARRHPGKLLGVGQALKYLGLEFEGTPHRGIDDAKNIAKIFIKEWQGTGLQLRKEHTTKHNPYLLGKS